MIAGGHLLIMLVLSLAADEDVARTEVERGPVKVTVEISPKVARLSDEPVMTLTIDAEEGVQVNKPPFGDALGAFIIRDFRNPLPEIKEGRQIIRQIYTLEPTGTGQFSIYPIALTFVDNRPTGDGKKHTIETEGLTVEVQSVLDSETPSLADLKPAKRPMALPEEPSYLIFWISGGALLLAAALLLVKRLKKRKPLPPEKRLSPEELAFLEFKQLLERNLVDEDIKLFYVELTGIVRRYIERTTGIRAPEQTTEEFLREVGGKPVFQGEDRIRLQDFLEAADLVKFAAFEPGKEQIEESFRRAKIFIGLEAGEVAA
jgi:hypothetical protein